VFVDDGSTDSTGEVIADQINRYPDRIAALRNETNLGKGESVRRGVLFAFSRADLVGYWDADLATPLDAIPELVVELERGNACLVMGSRIKIAGHEIIRNAWRHYLGRVFATLASTVIGHGFYDTQCGAKVFRKEIVEACFTQPFLSKWCFDIEMLLRLIRFSGITDINTVDSRVIEVPLRRWTDTGDTRLGVTDVFRMGIDLGRIACAYGRDSRP